MWGTCRKSVWVPRSGLQATALWSVEPRTQESQFSTRRSQTGVFLLTWGTVHFPPSPADKWNVLWEQSSEGGGGHAGFSDIIASLGPTGLSHRQVQSDSGPWSPGMLHRALGTKAHTVGAGGGFRWGLGRSGWALAGAGAPAVVVMQQWVLGKVFR
jgi:hypothetical protein